MVENLEELFFITATVCGWRPIFFDPKYASIVLDSLSWMKSNKRIKLFAFVLMPSHLHAIVAPISAPIGEILQQYGSFSAHAILNILRMENDQESLLFFQHWRRDRCRNLSIWQRIRAKEILTEKFLNQKLEYIHNNPVQGDKPLVKDRMMYKYSSACFYDGELPPIIPIDDIREWLVS